ncbi:MFS transporter, partial [Streptomyces sp. SID6648]|nr:MFS transporter [Streptomyces sp. SID6648]
IGSTELDTARRIIADSDTRLDVAGAWAVMQVELFTRLVGHASLGLIAARRRLPPEVLLPVFDRMVEEGFLTRHGSLLSHTDAGARE